MRIGILTFHRARNYGAMLQAYALRKFLIKKGHDVEFISYRHPKIETAYKAWLWKYNNSISICRNVKNFLYNLIILPKRLKRRRRFQEFAIKYLPESQAYTREQLLSQYVDYDYVIFGSDQIWTTRFLGEFDDILWGDIVLKDGKKVAYAPSMELRHVTEIEANYIRKHIENFDYISARETYMAKLLESITGYTVPTVLDPTLLCDMNEYSELITSSHYVPSEPYVLVYQICRREKVMEIAKKIANLLKCKIIEIGSNVLLHSDSTYKEFCCPADFVSLIANAKFVVSCSFHGTAFSINFHKPFYTILINGADSRVQSLLNQTNLEKCGIRSVDEIDIDSIMNIDYSKVENLLGELRKTSFAYINQAIN